MTIGALFRRVPVVAATAAISAASRDAGAQSEEAEQAPHEEPAPPAARWAVGANPLAVVLGRYGGDVQHLVAPGNALVLSVHVDYASKEFGPLDYSSSAPVWGVGGEAGWRFFPGAPGMRGLFLGASVLGGWDSIDYYGRRFGLYGFGLAGDIGGQAELSEHVFLTIGGGLQRLWTRRYPSDVAPGVSWVMGAGFDPRLLLAVGGLIR